MAVTETLTKVTCQLNLNNGTDGEGRIKTVSVSLGTLNADNWDADKAWAIITPLRDCLAKTLYSANSIKTNAMMNS